MSLLSSVNISLKSLYLLEKDVLIVEPLSSKTSLLYSIFISKFFSFLHISFIIIMKTFTPSDKYVIKYNFIEVVSFIKYISFSA